MRAAGGSVLQAPVAAALAGSCVHGCICECSGVWPHVGPYRAESFVECTVIATCHVATAFPRGAVFPLSTANIGQECRSAVASVAAATLAAVVTPQTHMHGLLPSAAAAP